jgi:hypothetical protein
MSKSSESMLSDAQKKIEQKRKEMEAKGQASVMLKPKEVPKDFQRK